MKDRLLFTIIIPVYNVAPYITQCLESIVKQSYSNIEIILIDDGSTDTSGEICEYYSQIDNRVILIKTENRGVSSARNLGINYANGDYIVFIDSDDWIEFNSIEKIENILIEKTYDVLIYGMLKNSEIDTRLDKIFKDIKAKGNHISNNKREIYNILPILIEKEIINSPIKVYKTSMLSTTSIRFNEKINIAEDLLFNMEVFLSSTSIFILDDFLYHYMIRSNASLTRKFNIKKYDTLMIVNKEMSNLLNRFRVADVDIEKSLLFIRLKNIYSCLVDISNKECNLNFKDKLKSIRNILKEEKKFNYDILDNFKHKGMSFMLNVNSPLLVYFVSRLLFIKKKKPFKLQKRLFFGVKLLHTKEK